MTIYIENLFDGELEEEIPSAADISLRDAIESLDEDMVAEALYAGADANKLAMNDGLSFSDECTPLLYVVREYLSGSNNLVPLLLNAGARADKIIYFGKHTPLFEASAQGNLEYMSILMKAGANVNFSTAPGHLDEPFGVTALMASIGEGGIDGLDADAKATQLLIDNGALVDAQDWEGFTPLMYAGFSGNVPCLFALLKAKASTSIQTNQGLTYLDYTAEFIEASGIDMSKIINLVDQGIEFKEVERLWTEFRTKKSSAKRPSSGRRPT